ncbi:MAG: methylated-DNA--[protein]-cysteine S-methyltransferase [Pseudomonadota bacterium]
MAVAVRTVETALGVFGIVEEDGAITALRWGAKGGVARSALIDAAAAQLAAYAEGRLKAFDLPLRPAGTAAEQKVFAAMRAIPWGETRSYGEIGAEVDLPARVVGQCCGANPIPVIIPCHRVSAADGRLGGFSAPGGVESKVMLLRHEGAFSLLL